MRTGERLYVPLGVRPGVIPSPMRTTGAGALVIGGIAALALLVLHFDAPPVLAAGIVLLALAPALLWPELATVLVVFLLYINFPAILTKQVGLPDVVAGGFIVLLAIPLAHTLFVGRERLRIDSTFLWMVAFLASLLVSSLVAVNQATALMRVLEFAVHGLLLYWLIINVVRNQRVLRRVIWTLLAAGSLLGGLSLYQEVTGSYHQEFGGLAYRNYVPPALDATGESVSRRQTRDRAQGPVDEPNRFAQVMIVLLPLAVLSYRVGSPRHVRLAAVVAGVVILGAIGITLSRGTFIAILLMAVAMAILRWVRPLHLVLCLTVLVLSIPLLTPHYVPRMLSIVTAAHLTADDPVQRNQADGAIRGRTTSMLTALHVFRDHPILGVGPGQFRYHYMAYVDNPDIVKFRDNRGVTRRAHSLYLEMAAETGIVGTFLFLGMVLLLMRELWRMRRRWLKQRPELADLATAFWLSLFAYLATGVFLHLSFQRYYWFLIALAAAALYVVKSVADDRPTAERPSRTVRLAGHALTDFR